MDMADLAADALHTGPDLFIEDNTAADARSQGDHDHIFIAAAASLPQLTQGSHIGIIGALYRHPVQKAA